MTSRDFCYWLQGFLEMRDEDASTAGSSLTPAQLTCIQKHLALVFKHEIDPSMGPPSKQQALDNIHNPPIHQGPGLGPLIRC